MPAASTKNFIQASEAIGLFIFGNYSCPNVAHDLASYLVIIKFTG